MRLGVPRNLQLPIVANKRDPGSQIEPMFDVLVSPDDENDVFVNPKEH